MINTRINEFSVDKSAGGKPSLASKIAIILKSTFIGAQGISGAS